MGEYFNTSKIDLVDYALPPGAARGKKGRMGEVDSLFGDFNVIPEDVPSFKRHMAQYEDKINYFTQQLMQNPEDYKQYAGDLAMFRNTLAKDVKYGKIGAYNQRYLDKEEAIKSASTLAKDDPTMASWLKDRINIPDFDETYKSELGRAGRVSGNFVDPWTRTKQAAWFEKSASLVKEELLKDAEYRNIAVPHNASIASLVSLTGKKVEDVQNMLANLLGEQDIRAIEQQLDFIGTPQSQADFYDFDKKTVNKDTYLGRLISDAAEDMAGIKRSSKDFQVRAPAAGAGRDQDMNSAGKRWYEQWKSASEGKEIAEMDTIELEGDRFKIYTFANTLNYPIHGHKYPILGVLPAAAGKAIPRVIVAAEKSAKSYSIRPFDFNMLITSVDAFNASIATAIEAWVKKNNISLPITGSVPTVSTEPVIDPFAPTTN